MKFHSVCSRKKLQMMRGALAPRVNGSECVNERVILPTPTSIKTAHRYHSHTATRQILKEKVPETDPEYQALIETLAEVLANGDLIYVGEHDLAMLHDLISKLGVEGLNSNQLIQLLDLNPPNQKPVVDQTPNTPTPVIAHSYVLPNRGRLGRHHDV